MDIVITSNAVIEINVHNGNIKRINVAALAMLVFSLYVHDAGQCSYCLMYWLADWLAVCAGRMLSSANFRIEAGSRRVDSMTDTAPFSHVRATAEGCCSPLPPNTVSAVSC